LRRATGPIALALARAADRATAQGQSTLRCRRKLPPPAASGLVVNAVVLEGRTLRLAVPDGNRTCGLRLDHDLADSVANQLSDATPRARSGLAQRRKLFLAKVNLGLLHMCHFNIAVDIRQCRSTFPENASRMQ